MVMKSPLDQTWGVRGSVYYLVTLLFAFIVVAVIYSTSESNVELPCKEPPEPEYIEPSESVDAEGISVNATAMTTECNYFDGKWIYDNTSYPLYKEKDCSFMLDYLTCEKNGRQDLSYQNWRWQPHHCDLPRFNATTLLNHLRDKRLVFVGDSLNRGQWESMVCLAETSIPTNLKSMRYAGNNGSLAIFKAIEYNATIEFYWEPLLVESNCDNPVIHKVLDRVVRIHGIEKHARHWIDANILVFNSYLWWRLPKLNVLWGSFEGQDGIYKDVEMPRIFEMGLQTWAEWLEFHVNRSKTQLFFVSMSPTHQLAVEWGGKDGQNCYGELEQITKEGYSGWGSDPKVMHIVDSTIDGLKKRGLNVQMINITQLSEYRKEAHLSINRNQWDNSTALPLLADPTSYADCAHWCLPGVPDIWNELLYAHIIHS